MAYATAANVRALTGLGTNEVSAVDLATICSIVDTQIDIEPEVALSTNQKGTAADYLAAALALENYDASTSIANLLEISGAIKIDARSAANIRNARAKSFYEKYKYIISFASKDDLIKRVP